LLLSRLRQFAGKKRDLVLQIGKGGGTTSTRGRWRVVALRPGRPAVLRFCRFPANCAAPSHVALPVGQTALVYHIVRVVVQHSKIDRRSSAVGQRTKPLAR